MLDEQSGAVMKLEVHVHLHIAPHVTPAASHDHYEVVRRIASDLPLNEKLQQRPWRGVGKLLSIFGLALTATAVGFLNLKGSGPSKALPIMAAENAPPSFVSPAGLGQDAKPAAAIPVDPSALLYRPSVSPAPERASGPSLFGLE
jgi:hypothetical protein